MFNETALKKQDLDTDKYRDSEYENLSKTEKVKILKSMTKKEIFYAKENIKLCTLELEKLLQQYIDTFNEYEISSFSNYKRYFIMSYYHNRLLYHNCNNRTHNNVRKKLYSLKEYEAFYQLNQKVIETLHSFIIIIECIKVSKAGLIDTDLTDKIKQASINRSIKRLQSFLKKQRKDEKKDLLLSNINYYDNNQILDFITSNNINFVKEIETYEIDKQLRDKNIEKEKKKEIILNLLNGSTEIKEEYNYELFEQILLAPIKLRFFIDDNKSKLKNTSAFNEIELFLKNSGIWNKEEELKLLEAKKNSDEFFKIGKNQLLSYCITVFSEFFAINPFDIKRIYTLFYSDSKSMNNTNFLKLPYVHMKTIESDGYLYNVEYLPYLRDDFKDIFYDIEEKPLLKIFN